MGIALIIVVAAILIYFVLKSNSQPTQEKNCIEPRKAVSRRFRIAGLSYRCTRKDIGIVMGKVGYDPSNEHDPNAIAIIANIDQPNEKLLGFIKKEDQAHFGNLAYKEKELPFLGFIEDFENEEGKRMLFGKIRVYSGSESDVEADMANDLKVLTECFGQRNYKRRIMLLDEW